MRTLQNSHKHCGFFSNTHCSPWILSTILPARSPTHRSTHPTGLYNSERWWWLHASPRLTHAVLTSLLFFKSRGRSMLAEQQLSGRNWSANLQERGANATTVAHYCTAIAQIHTHIGNAAFFPPCISNNTFSFCPSCDPPLARSPHLLPCPYKVFLLHAGRCNLRSKLSLTPCGKFRHKAGHTGPRNVTPWIRILDYFF